MTKTTCPTCGCERERVYRGQDIGFCNDKHCEHPSHYKPLPQPDLTKLREVYENHMLLVNESAKKIKADKTKKEVLQEQILDSFTEVIQAVKEVLDAETKTI